MAEQVCENCNNWQAPEKTHDGPYVVMGVCLLSLYKMNTFPTFSCLLYEPKPKPMEYVIFSGEDEH